MPPSTKLRALEFRVFRKPPPIKIERVFAAVSGGPDSIALLSVLNQLKARWDFDLHVVHVHHGAAKSKATTAFRSRAEKLAAAVALRMNLPFVTLKVSSDSESEEALRDVRFRALEDHAAKSGGAVLALGHHADDLFETRLIRLLRGTGPQGLSAMTEISRSEGGATLWRPLLSSAKIDVEHYLSEIEFQKNRDWLHDPSNRQSKYLRNAVRHQLIPLLEKLRPGGVAAMARSLELLAEFVELPSNSTQSRQGALNRADLLNLNLAQRKSRLSAWVKAQGLRGISKSQIEEILKRIDTPKKRLTFEIGGRVWTVDQEIHFS